MCVVAVCDRSVRETFVSMEMSSAWWSGMLAPCSFERWVHVLVSV